MIQYPSLHKPATIGVTALSSGVPEALHPLLKGAEKSLQKRGYQLIFGESAWTQHKAKSAPADVRAKDFHSIIQNGKVDFLIPPWGGELLVETLEHLDFNRIPSKWILGYSDTSVLLLAITLTKGIATAHGTNLVDLRGESMDETTAMWEKILLTKAGESVTQHSSALYQKKWDFENPTPHIFDLTEETEWKTVSGNPETMKGRLLGGCIDVVRHLIGTPYGDVEAFRNTYIQDEPVLWFFENCELSTTDLRRSLMQMKLAGWFEHCSGMMFGRSAANHEVDGYTAEDVYKDLSEELQIPVIYDIDCGHMPPQVTLINGAYAEVEVKSGKGTVVQHFR
ncbi:S66 family peptidase [Jeotgalibacillus terrae]|uniref:S66 peptidase family protein n=1 Tax=Jeotgalibacillus terrae TaxID=587735 RepID=A0ABW5ZJY9_9BACL|nr:S66 peptidase family protein [Jeotgalibacillus terrae]MBM7578648.1 muramoyltetrapeptide carboxypeptidase LdcA involved in peptidoglycan recycling [Jeotgalibacillus terrae]